MKLNVSVIELKIVKFINENVPNRILYISILFRFKEVTRRVKDIQNVQKDLINKKIDLDNIQFFFYRTYIHFRRL